MKRLNLVITSNAYHEALRDYMLGGCTEEKAQAMRAAAKAHNEAVDAYQAETKAEENRTAALVDQMKVDLIQGAGMVNDMADKSDLERNHVNYGIATQAAKALRGLGVDASVPHVWGDNEFLRIPKVVIEGKEIEYHNGQHGSGATVQQPAESNEGATMADKWLKSKAGTWHLYGGTIGGDDKAVAACQSYNLDRPNYLIGEAAQEPPKGARVCKKCTSQVNK